MGLSELKAEELVAPLRQRIAELEAENEQLRASYAEKARRYLERVESLSAAIQEMRDRLVRLEKRI